MAWSLRGWSPGRRKARWTEPQISFKEAVPLRAERRDLRRRLRATARAQLAEQAQVLTNELQRLAGRRVGVAAVTPGPEARSETVDFVDRNRLVLEMPGRTAELDRLVDGSGPGAAYLAHVETCFGRCWYRLRFRSVWGTDLEVLAKVLEFGPSVVTPIRPPHKWPHRPGAER